MITESESACLDMNTNPSDSGKKPLVKGTRESAACAGLFGAILRAGSAAERTGQVGDAILIYPAKGFFAIGDSSDREPSAARQFLRRFSDVLKGIPILSRGGVLTDDQLDYLLSDIITLSREMLNGFSIQGTTTFTGIVLLRTRSISKAVLFHAGDSDLFAYNPLNGIRRVTEKNFWLLGKAREFYQVDIFDMKQGDRFLFATDGIQDLTPPGGEEFVSYLEELFSRYPVEDIPEILIDHCDTKTEGRDDLAMLSLAPEGPFQDIGEILLGG